MYNAAMQKIYKPRYPTRNAGFWFAFVSALLSYGLGALLVIGLLNNNKSTGGTFDWGGAIIVMVVTLLVLAVTTAVVYWIMRIQPKQIVLDDTRLVVQDLSVKPPVIEADIPLEAVTYVSVADVAVEGGLFPASFRGLLVRWKPEAVLTPAPTSSAVTASELKAPAPASVEPTATADPASVEEPKTTDDNLHYEYVISSRHIQDFDELFDTVFARVPKEARGTRTFRL